MVGQKTEKKEIVKNEIEVDLKDEWEDVSVQSKSISEDI